MAVIQAGKSGIPPSTTSSSSTQNEEEQVPTYEEATTSRPAPVMPPSNGKGAHPFNPAVGVNGDNSSNNAPSNSNDESRRLYPFPSLGTQRDGYGQSPYQSDGTLRIPIVSNPTMNSSNNQGGGGDLPFPSLQSRRGPRAGRRFCVAFFWAVILYMCMIAIYTGLDNSFNTPAHRHPLPGWHHHHHPKHDEIPPSPPPRKGKKGDHRNEDWFNKRSFGISSLQKQ